MQGISGFSPPPLSFGPLPLVKGEIERGSDSTDSRFLQSILEVASGQKISNPIVATGPENSQLDFFTNPEKVISQVQKKEKGVDDILAEIEKLLNQLKENN